MHYSLRRSRTYSTPVNEKGVSWGGVQATFARLRFLYKCLVVLLSQLSLCRLKSNNGKGAVASEVVIGSNLRFSTLPV